MMMQLLSPHQQRHCSQPAACATRRCGATARTGSAKGCAPARARGRPAAASGSGGDAQRRPAMRLAVVVAAAAAMLLLRLLTTATATPPTAARPLPTTLLVVAASLCLMGWWWGMQGGVEKGIESRLSRLGSRTGRGRRGKSAREMKRRGRGMRRRKGERLSVSRSPQFAAAGARSAGRASEAADISRGAFGRPRDSLRTGRRRGNRRRKGGRRRERRALVLSTSDGRMDE